MRRDLLMRMLLVAALVCAGCSDDAEPPQPDSAQLDGGTQDGSTDGSAVENPEVFITFNAGLVEGAVPYAVERQPLIIDALKQTAADVLCLQEVWTDASATALTEGLKASYPYAFREKTEDTSEVKVRCTNIGAVLALKSCVDNNCVGVSASTCVSTTCKSQYDVLDDACKQCLAANTDDPTSCAIGGTKEFVQEGRNGLLLLSRLPLVDPSYTALDTALVKRGVISATIGTTTVLCTHLPSDLGAVPYPSGKTATSWKEEHAGAVNDVLQLASASSCNVLLGDLNTGPATNGLTGELVENFALLSSFDEPWNPPLCTWCKANPYTGSDTDQWIDHIMFKGCSGTPTYSRAFDGEVTFTSEGQSVTGRLSDHYGLEVNKP